MQEDIQHLHGGIGPFKAEKLLHQQQMAAGRDGKEFTQALDQPQQGTVQHIHSYMPPEIIIPNILSQASGFGKLDSGIKHHYNN